eukprot:gnl/Chilomastix_caulleri/1135.p1 GENE.gnl/Chilomastix_caulleri/1135~~gnl/Chilomastix_caulleri/1135.p1  ORF type:complete len:131 (+),score=55.43 gnl/Chilomastix_caulleri/1135:114-506(+)
MFLLIPLLVTQMKRIPGMPGELSLWSFIDVHKGELGGDNTLGRVIEHLTETYKMDILIITFGAAMLWQPFGEFVEREKLSLREALSEATGELFTGDVADIIVVADPVVEDGENMEEPPDGYDYPTVRVYL